MALWYTADDWAIDLLAAWRRANLAPVVAFVLPLLDMAVRAMMQPASTPAVCATCFRGGNLKWLS